jgi:FMN phosphatase YigB (HAD superfamily)
MGKIRHDFVELHGAPKAVIFDTDNTLYPYSPAHNEATRVVEEKAEKVLGIERSIFRSAFQEAREEIKARLGSVASSHSRLLYMQRTIEKLQLGTRILTTLDLEQTYWRTFLNSCRLFPGALDFIHLLKSMGVVTANITDLTAQIQFRKLIYFGLDELFDYVVTSEEAGADKPDKRPFEVALKKMNMEPKNIWMIGDHAIKDIQGARDTINAITLQKFHHGVEVGTGVNEPDAIFSSYSEVISLLTKFKKNN